MRILRPEEINAQNMASLKFGELTPEELKEAYALARAEFSPADWEGIDLNDSVPAEEFIRELEDILKQSEAKKAP